MRNRAFRTVAITASLLLLLAAAPAQASPVVIGDVVQVVSGNQRNGGQNASVELRFLANDDKASAGTKTTATTSGGNSALVDGASSGVTTTVVQDAGGVIQTEVTEDIGVEECECGDFTIPVAGFPKWPFIPLVGLVCLTGVCTDDDCVPAPGQDENCREVVCTDCTNEVPEPASLLLFGSGMVALGARLRRRRSTQPKDQAANTSGS